MPSSEIFGKPHQKCQDHRVSNVASVEMIGDFFQRVEMSGDLGDARVAKGETKGLSYCVLPFEGISRLPITEDPLDKNDRTKRNPVLIASDSGTAAIR